MTTLTVRNLDESLKARLRVRAAICGRSMEAEVRQILKDVLDPPVGNLAEEIHRLFAPLGGLDLPNWPQDPIRDPPSFD